MRVYAVLAALLLAAGSALAQQPHPTKPAPKPAPAPAKPQPKSPFTPPAFKITIATEGAFPPFNYLDKKGLPAGFEMELAQEACQRMKAECEYTVVKWDDLIPGLLDKKFDIIMSSLEVNNERRRRLGLSRRYYLSPGAFIAHKGEPFDGPPTLLRNKRLGVQKDSTHADWIDKSFRRSAQIKRYPTLADAVAATGPFDIVDVFRRAEFCPDHAREAVASGARCLWLQLGIVSVEAARIAAAGGLAVVMDRCTKVEHARLLG